MKESNQTMKKLMHLGINNTINGQAKASKC